jgi:serine/threonine protein kinase
LSSTVDARSEVYSLGCVLFEMLTGRTPFRGDLFTLIEQHRSATAPRVRSIAPELDERLDALVAQMLAKDPGARPQTMGDVQRALVAIGHQVRRSAVFATAPVIVARTVQRSESVATIVRPRCADTEGTICVPAREPWKQRCIVAAVVALFVGVFALAAPDGSRSQELAVETSPSTSLERDVTPPPIAPPIIEHTVAVDEIELDEPPPKPVKRTTRTRRAPKWDPNALFPKQRR